MHDYNTYLEIWLYNINTLNLFVTPRTNLKDMTCAQPYEGAGLTYTRAICVDKPSRHIEYNVAHAQSLLSKTETDDRTFKL